MDEQSLVRIYVELMGTSESCARGVFMYVVPEEARAVSMVEKKEFGERQRPKLEAKTSRDSIQRRPATRLPKVPTTLAGAMSS